MGRYLDEAGNPVDASSPRRLIFYGALCSYWTDNWDNLKHVGPGIPCCPKCLGVGYQTNAKDWEDGATLHDMGNPGYFQFLNDHREECHGLGIGGFGRLWQEHKDKLKQDKLKQEASNGLAPT